MKKMMTLALALMMMLMLAACGGKADPAPSGNGGTTDPGTTDPGATAPGATAPGGSEQGQTTQDANKDALVSKVGDTASFGSYNGKPIEWLCIDVQGENALLIAKDCVALDVFNEPMPDGSEVVWADCTLRAWLNGEFLNGLSAEEQARILATEHSDKENLDFADYPEEDVEWKTCTDRVFLLSAKEVQTHFIDDVSRIAKISLSDAERSAVIARYEEVLNMDDGTGTDYVEEFVENDGTVEYWLRSNGRGYMVQTVSYDGVYSDYGSNQDASFKGVRPAIWVSLANDGTETDTPNTTKPNETTAAPGSNEVVDFDIGISAIPAEWQKAIGNSMFGMNTGAMGDSSDSYTNKFGDVSAEDYAKLIAYFDTLSYTEKLEGVYNCDWGQLQIGHNADASEMTITWLAN